MDNLISISEYAKMHGVKPDTIKKKCQRGMFETARKIGNTWVISRDEPFVDNRVKTGKYIGWRNKKNTPAK